VSRVAVIGAGAWGTTLAWMLGGKGVPVRLWARRAEQAAALTRDRENVLHLPGTLLPDNVAVTADLSLAVDGATCAIIAVPSEHLRSVAAALAPSLPSECLLISATKGLEIATGRRMSQVLREETGAGAERVFALSGPNLSGEIVAGMPAVSVLAGSDTPALVAGQQLLSGPLFRVYANCDILGVEVCGALKNVIAIAAGVAAGLGFGANAKAALVARGLAEIGRLGSRLGAQRATFWGAAGVGDVVATCHSPLSRNWQVGHALGRGEALAQVTQGRASVAEGVPTTAAARELARREQVEVPITCALYEVLYEHRRPADAVRDLMTRPWRVEAEDWQ
jgi:glycerol-3-phosphate dehydrogenase (NAD(P)+)